MRGTFSLLSLLALTCASACAPGTWSRDRYYVATAYGACDGQPDGAACSDGNSCTQNDECQAGVCVGGPLKSCPTYDFRSSATLCDPHIGECRSPPPSIASLFESDRP